MRENEPVLLVFSVFDVKLFLRKVKFYLRNVTRLDLLIDGELFFTRKMKVEELES